MIPQLQVFIFLKKNCLKQHCFGNDLVTLQVDPVTRALDWARLRAGFDNHTFFSQAKAKGDDSNKMKNKIKSGEMKLT